MRVLFFIFCFLIAATAAAQSQRFAFTRPKMGSPFNLVFYAPDSARPTVLADGAFALVDSLNAIFSDYDSSSELSCLNRTAGSDQFIPVSAPLFSIIQQSLDAGRQSRGAFDITMGPLSWVWRQSRRTRQFPPDSLVQKAKAKIGFRNIQLDAASHRVKLFKKAMLLDLGGIAKGYAAQAVVDFLAAEGIQNALADAGGDIACSGAPPGKKGWTIGINVPEQANTLLPNTIQLQTGAVATSGDVYQFTEHKGKRYSHIINPKTGYGVTFQRNVTLIARNGATADWLATACSIVSVRKAKKMARQNGAALLIGVLKKQRVRFYKTASFKRYLASGE